MPLHIQDLQDRQTQKQNAEKLLAEYRTKKLTLKRPVFFVPGWSDESGHCWGRMREVAGGIFTNPKDAVFIDFTNDTKDCSSFYDFGARLTLKVRETIDPRAMFDFVGHSMGGLDIRAALTDGEKPLTRCATCITVATPHQGDRLGGMRNVLAKVPILSGIINALHPIKDFQIKQGRSMDPDNPAIERINETANRKLFLEHVERLYQLKGTQDFVVKGSAVMDDDGVKTLTQQKSKQYLVEGSNHSGKIGICLDVRTIVLIVNLLNDVPVPEDRRNYGNLLGGNFKPGENPDRFV